MGKGIGGNVYIVATAHASEYVLAKLLKGVRIQIAPKYISWVRMIPINRIAIPCEISAIGSLRRLLTQESMVRIPNNISTYIIPAIGSWKLRGIAHQIWANHAGNNAVGSIEDV